MMINSKLPWHVSSSPIFLHLPGCFLLIQFMLWNVLGIRGGCSNVQKWSHLMHKKKQVQQFNARNRCWRKQEKCAGNPWVFSQPMGAKPANKIPQNQSNDGSVCVSKYGGNPQIIQLIFGCSIFFHYTRSILGYPQGSPPSASEISYSPCPRSSPRPARGSSSCPQHGDDHKRKLWHQDVDLTYIYIYLYIYI